jgi:Glycosyltransferase (GlcNAc)
MAVIRRPGSSSSTAQGPALYAIFTIFVVLIIYFATVTDDVPAADTSQKGSNPLSLNGSKNSLRHAVVQKRHQLQSALKSLTTQQLPARLARLRDNHEIVGERLREIRSGSETVEEVLHGRRQSQRNDGSIQIEKSDKPPMQLDEIIQYLTDWIHTLHTTLVSAKHETYFGIWDAYHDLTVKTLYPWDREYLQRMPERRNDGTIFLSLASYRDENCPNTIKEAYAKAKNPEKLFVGLVQQNCHANCRSGILVGGGTEEVPPDEDCKKAFCESESGKELCAKGHIRVLEIDEPESLGPYAARYFASKLWYGENWFMQTDAVCIVIQIQYFP